ncbi:hypothetical protein PY257_06695 [Ramlibacter sp. H39-3-26]|nr:hypothetical protein [Ramlibacter sp. H39-3-26]
MSSLQGGKSKTYKESHPLRQNCFDKLLIFKGNAGILPAANQQANIKTTIKSRDAGCATAFVFPGPHRPACPQTAATIPVRAAKSHGTSV